MLTHCGFLRPVCCQGSLEAFAHFFVHINIYLHQEANGMMMPVLYMRKLRLKEVREGCTANMCQSQVRTQGSVPSKTKFSSTLQIADRGQQSNAYVYVHVYTCAYEHMCGVWLWASLR